MQQMPVRVSALTHDLKLAGTSRRSQVHTCKQHGQNRLVSANWMASLLQWGYMVVNDRSDK